MTAPAHSKLGASSAYRWMSCAGSVALSERMPKRESEYAAEGTAAHTLAEACLKRGFDATEYVGETMGVAGVPEFTVTEEMAEAVQVYLDTVRGDRADGDVPLVEHRFALTEFHPAFFGTNDACLYKPAERKLVVYDYKHGRGVAVEVERNPQLMYYGLGAATAESRPLDVVELVIVQPRAQHRDGPVRRWQTTAQDLVEYAADLVEAAARTEASDAPLAAGDWCKFCPAAPVCPELKKRALDAAQVDFNDNNGEPILRDPAVMTPDELGAVLDAADIIEQWYRSVQSHANAEALAGRLPSGWKLVEGKQGNRKFRDEAEARMALLELGVEPEHQNVEPKLRSPTQIATVLKQRYGFKGKAADEAIADLVTREPGGPRLVRESDPRPAIARDPDADFGEAAA